MTCGEVPPWQPVDCRLRYLYCLRPFGSLPPDVPLLPQAPLTTTTFEEGFIAVGAGDQINFWNRSNPFTRAATVAGKIILTICCVDLVLIMQGRAQFYIVVYGFIAGTPVARVVDRFPIDLELSVLSGPTARRTYSGIHNVSQFELSFRIDGHAVFRELPWPSV